MLVFRYFGVEMKADILQGVLREIWTFQICSISSEYDFSMCFALYLKIKNADIGRFVVDGHKCIQDKQM